jgi:predicted small lipoprotein YifL
MVRREYVGTFGVNFTQGSKLALVGVALLVLALGGCGRKSGLDLPPQAAAQPASGDPAQGPVPLKRNSLGLFDAEEEDRPIEAKGQKRRIILDNILD